METGDEPTPSNLTPMSTPASADKAGKKTKKNTDEEHGLKFESKLRALFCIRALGAGYRFELGKGREDLGGKFDDVIFRYQVPDETPEGKHWLYRYLQAKHKENENDKINADHLLDKGKGDFSLPKYFRSFCMISRRGGDIQDCIICTNINFYVKGDNKDKRTGFVANDHQPDENLKLDPQEKKGEQTASDRLNCTRELQDNANDSVWIKHKQQDVIKLIRIKDENERIFEFGPQEKTARYKLEFTDELQDEALKEWPSDIDRLAEKLQDFGKISEDKKKIDMKIDVFKNFHVALIKEHVIVIDPTNKTNGKFHEDFLKGAKHLEVRDVFYVSPLSDGANQLCQILSKKVGYVELVKWKFQLSNNFGKSQTNGETENGLPLKIEVADLEAFLEKLVFVVNMPNEERFEEILQTEDVSKYYTRKECKQQTNHLLKEIPVAIQKAMEGGDWLTSEKAKEILLEGAREISTEYQTKLKTMMGFNENASNKMTVKLTHLLANGNRIERIITQSPKHTAVKVFSAIQNVPEYNRNESFLVVKLSSLQDKDRWKNILKLNQDSHHLLIVVCDKETPDPCHYADLVPDNQKVNKIMFLCRDGTGGMTDSITFAELSEKFQKAILQKTITFQGTTLTVNELVGNEPDKAIDYLSIEELLFQQNKDINIYKSDTSAYEKSSYIERRLMTAFNKSSETKLANRLNFTVDQLQDKCRITAQGGIKWLVKHEERQSIWEAIKRLTDEQVSSNAIDESQLIRLDEGSERLPVVIISGVAGTGKSTLLSHYYMGMKRAKPDHWIIKINLVEHETALSPSAATSEVNGVDFLVKQLHIVANDSLFSRSLLRHRIKTGDRIAFMFDGFDEISRDCQQNVIRLMKMLAEKETIELYVTTRPHMVEELQSGLFQLAHHLQILAEKGQIDYLIKHWQANLQNIETENKPIIIKKFAEALAHRVSQTLTDEEKSFIGVPLQCRILAECYQSDVEEQIKNDNVNVTLRYQNFDLKSLYDCLLEAKRRIFRKEKTKSLSIGDIGSCAMDFLIDDIESHLTKLAIETLVVKEKNVNILWPSRLSYYHSATEKSEKEKTTNDLGVKYGLVLFTKGEEKSKVQFIHRTYAEYLFARYLHRGMDITTVEENQLLDGEPVRKLIINEILVENNYQGVRVFLNSMLNKTEVGRRTKLPHQLKKFAEDLAQHIKNPQQFSSVFINRYTNALIAASKTANLFQFLLDCLDGSLGETETKPIIKAAFEQFLS
ncbi:uncharacterized protein LOC130694041 [Daphnia carinata]|uniref:uncharacterized protein LOC130694041 n=1 Tax=Daphnia carinata TaxID=120202 RepID=UPI00257C349F|nr:uncharacterized protein LOC130694041 [Daphnia carinata]